MTIGHRLFCEELLGFNTMPCPRMPVPAQHSQNGYKRVPSEETNNETRNYIQSAKHIIRACARPSTRVYIPR